MIIQLFFSGFLFLPVGNLRYGCKQDEGFVTKAWGRGECSNRSTGNLRPATHLAILYADPGDRRKSPGVPGAAIAVLADRGDRRLKSHVRYRRLNSPAFAKCARSRDFYAHRCAILSYEQR